MTIGEQAKLTVARETILSGIVIAKPDLCHVQIETSNKNEVEKLSCNIISTGYSNRRALNLGDSIHLKPNCDYKISVKYLEIAPEIFGPFCPIVNADVKVNDPDNSIEAIHSSALNVLEMFFKAPHNCLI